MPFCIGVKRFSLWVSPVILALILFEPLSAGVIPRKILALYKTSEKRSPEHNEISEYVQLVLNNLGLVVVYADAEDTLPPIWAMPEYLGVITFFYNDGMRRAGRYRKWLLRLLENGKKVVIFGNFGAMHEYGASSTRKDRREVRRLFSRMGLSPPIPMKLQGPIRLQKYEAGMFDFEYRLSSGDIQSATHIQSFGNDNRVLMTLEAAGQETVLALTAPWGGMAQRAICYRMDPATGRAQWYLDPFAFLETALALQDLPRAELNLIGGRRTAFCHIDGDGFRTISLIDGWSMCADIMTRKVFSRYDLPFSVSVITAEVDPVLFGSMETLSITRRMFALPNVEPASHSFAHPFDWRKGTVAFDTIPGYTFDPYREIVGSMRFIQTHLLPAQKAVKLFFWSGMGNPTDEQIALIEKHGWLQINGRAGYLDDSFPSITSFAPPYTQIGDRFRINARISNEYEFTRGWQPPYDAYVRVIRTFEFTQKYGPLTPANLYLHFYIMQYRESWNALKRVLKWVMNQDWTFVYASDYVKMVQDFLSLSLQRLGPDHFRIDNQGALRTIRFKKEKRIVDMQKSKNVVGYGYYGEDLVVHLDGRREHEIVLTADSARQVYLQSFNMLVDSTHFESACLDFYVKGYGRFEAVLVGLPPNAYFKIEKNLQCSHEFSALASSFDFRIRYVQADDMGRVVLKTPVMNETKISLVPVSRSVYWFHKLRIVMLLAIIFLGFVLYHRHLATKQRGQR